MKLELIKSLYKHPNDYIYVVKEEGKIIKKCLTKNQAKQFITKHRSK